MKLLIDVDEKLVFEGFERPFTEEEKAILIRAIGNGRTYNPPDDLISRSDALKAVDDRHEELLHDSEYRKKHCQIDLLGIKKHILAIPPVIICKEEVKDVKENNKESY